MPFTPSHAIVALPSVRTPLVPAAIAIGSMTPDLPLFLGGVGPSYGFLHGAPNLVWTSLVAAVLLLIWRVVLRPASVELVPSAVARRMPQEWRMTGAAAVYETFWQPRRRGYPMLLAASLAIGVASHILWDSFTHAGRWGVSVLPALDERWGPFVAFKWFQYGSGVVGMVVLVAYAARWLSRRPVSAAPQRLPAGVRVLWIVSLPVLLVIAGVGALVSQGPLSTGFTPTHLVYGTLVPAGAFWGGATLVLCLWIVLSARAAPRTTP